MYDTTARTQWSRATSKKSLGHRGSSVCLSYCCCEVIESRKLTLDRGTTTQIEFAFRGRLGMGGRGGENHPKALFVLGIS